MKDINYIQISGWMINQLKLKDKHLLCYGLIFGFSQDGEGAYTGSISYLCDFLQCSKPTAIKVLRELTEDGLLIKETKTINNIIFNSYKINLLVVKNLNWGGLNSLTGGGKESLPNNNNLDNNRNHNNTAPAEKAVAGTLFPEQDVKRKTLFKNSLVADFEKFKKQFSGAEFQKVDILHYYNSVHDWSEQKDVKRTANGWVATARTWMRNDLQKGTLKTVDKKGEDLEYQEYLKMSYESGN